MIGEAIHNEGGIHVQDELCQKVIVEVLNCDVLDVEVGYLLYQSRILEVIEECGTFLFTLPESLSSRAKAFS